MVDANSLIEGHCKFRDGRKWKSRWAVITKLSPVADCLQLQVYRDEKERARNGHTKASLSLQDFLALETGFTLDKESHTLAIICQDLCVVLAFDNRERLIQWSVRIANNLGEGQHFLVQLSSAPSKSKLTPGPVKLHVTDRKFCLTAGIPPKLLGTWEVSHLRRYGVVDGRIVFEGGSRCGKGEGVHVLVPDPPQLNLIIDAFDMSSKGQLARAPSRRFGSVVDSPRKSMTSRLSEMRSLMITPTESTANLSLAPSTNLTITSSNITCPSSTTIMQAPRESRSAEALCTACGEHPQVNFNGGAQQSMWKSSDSSSSRCDLDNCLDNISLVHCPAEDNIAQKVSQLSPARNPLSAHNQPLQIAKPLPSAMERCLSCMSKLGQQGTQDILSPSWTMDLNSLSNSAGPGNGGSNGVSSGNNSLGVALPQGSIGSGNSDRLSISSHGSSGGGGGGGGGPNGGEFYGNYDTPRSVLVAEMRRSSGRCNTPPGVFQGGNGGSNCHFSSAGQSGGQPCGSPYRRPACGQQQQGGGGPGGSNNIIGCGVGNCHCQRGPVGVGVNNSHIYYNSQAEQQHTSNKSHKASNLHPGGHLPGPYENYDFPRCVQPPPQALSLNSYPSYSGESVVSGCVSSNGPSSIDWAKKPPMDRSSVATTASLLGSDSLSSSEFYDTPRQLCPCCAPTTNTGCPCCVNHSSSSSAIHGIHQQHQQHPQQQSHQHHPMQQQQQQQQGPLPLIPVQQQQQQQQQHSHYQNPSCIMRRGDPMENYDVPPHNNPHNAAIQSQIQQMTSSSSTPSSSTSISINGEGKMPLVAGSMNNGGRPNPHAIYAQVDKSKKTPRPIPPKQHQPQLQPQHIYSNNCDTHPIYENRNAQLQSQPTYINLPSETLCHNNVSNGGGSGKPPALNPTVQSHNSQQKQVQAKSLPPPQNPQCPHGHSNYVNLDFSESLQLYENAKEIAAGVSEESARKDECNANNNANVNSITTVLVHAEPPKKIIIETIVENEYENSILVGNISSGAAVGEEKVGESRESAKGQEVEEEEVKVAGNELGRDETSEEKSSSVTSRSNSLSVDEALTSTSGSSGSDGRRGSNQEATSSSSEEAGANLPLRRSSSVPCKGGHANRGSASSSDSGVSGDGGLFFDDSSPLNDIGSLCLHESLPRKSTHRTSPGASNGKNTSATSTPRPVEGEERESGEGEPATVSSSPPLDPLLANRHYETIDEVEAKMRTASSNGGSTGSVIVSTPVNPSVAAVKKCADPVQKRNLVSDANSTSSGNSDMSDYIETLSSCSRGSADTLTSVLGNNGGAGQPVNLGISASPKKSTSMKPRSGKEYFKIDRSMFKSD